MTASITYMGTKRDLAEAVAAVVAKTRDGLLLDAFAGMGAIASAVAAKRQVWTNDVQRFSHLVGTCLFTSQSAAPKASVLVHLVEDLFLEHLSKLSETFAELFQTSSRALRTSSFDEMALLTNRCDELVESIGDCLPYQCFLRRYSNSYFSVHQAAEIDALRLALDQCFSSRLITDDQFNWALMALGRASLKVANTPGHFAQFLRANSRTFRRIQRQGRRSIWTEWLVSVEELKPVGTAAWRSANRATCSDSLDLLQSSQATFGDISTVYCDPPYTDDQYSRFYHIWETLVLYDDPPVTGTGRYRHDRFVTPFSKKTTVVGAMDKLVSSVKTVGADIVLSYPSNGLLYECGCQPMDILLEHFPKAEVAYEVDHAHSTFGASKGLAKSAVREIVYLGRQ